MKQAEKDKLLQSDPELDAALARMAEEVPPMPADFHDKWMNAVRAEAREACSAEEKKAEGSPVSSVRWIRILSAAAVFVFLIGGTILYRNSRRFLAPVFRTDEKSAALTAAQIPAAGAVPDTEMEEEAEDAGTEVFGMDAGMPVISTSPVQEAGTENGLAAKYTADSYDEAPAMMEKAPEETADEVSAEAAEEPMPVPLATGVPTAAAFSPEQEAEKPEEETGLMIQVKDFIVDMGDFLLAALPYLAVLAVPALIALLLRYRKNQQGNNRV